jgi:hypothetical protein
MGVSPMDGAERRPSIGGTPMVRTAHGRDARATLEPVQGGEMRAIKRRRISMLGSFICTSNVAWASRPWTARSAAPPSAGRRCYVKPTGETSVPRSSRRTTRWRSQLLEGPLAHGRGYRGRVNPVARCGGRRGDTRGASISDPHRGARARRRHGIDTHQSGT